MTDFKRETAKQRKSLFIAAGHSYSDPGASGHGYTEADIVLDLRDRLCKALRARGVVIGMDGEKGENLPLRQDRKSTRLNSSHVRISYAVFCLKKKNQCTRASL